MLNKAIKFEDLVKPIDFEQIRSCRLHKDQNYENKLIFINKILAGFPEQFDNHDWLTKHLSTENDFLSLQQIKEVLFGLKIDQPIFNYVINHSRPFKDISDIAGQRINLLSSLYITFSQIFELNKNLDHLTGELHKYNKNDMHNFQLSGQIFLSGQFEKRVNYLIKELISPDSFDLLEKPTIQEHMSIIKNDKVWGQLDKNDQKILSTIIAEEKIDIIKYPLSYSTLLTFIRSPRNVKELSRLTLGLINSGVFKPSDLFCKAKENTLFIAGNPVPAGNTISLEISAFINDFILRNNSVSQLVTDISFLKELMTSFTMAMKDDALTSFVMDDKKSELIGLLHYCQTVDPLFSKEYAKEISNIVTDKKIRSAFTIAINGIQDKGSVDRVVLFACLYSRLVAIEQASDGELEMAYASSDEVFDISFDSDDFVFSFGDLDQSDNYFSKIKEMNISQIIKNSILEAHILSDQKKLDRLITILDDLPNLSVNAIDTIIQDN
ncbi:MAG: hypothetical protein DKM50_13780 [Candidatus Margulisiibacteriota bacterium]|nr:MAG: hypothetical protein A2X43_09970 [Candidatus Margulisbacteria bacterium GWD2_39_127]OGI05454.1 MAG: hypothetical protein A2X42_11765 [Candidatus Margulisbacteria bacterium GWF2_38_17]OGI07679.1 MAG: hypothetical protein A2X41_04580 [Candidatus Margulisbacteria bacterium GWE2_39_32]PZM77211.1 MAG: hypothetical protein DKM50_13780 [Candidatus Margulisiibacteriota bacterium]HAR61901.1 hypothetical protein [Candidatus Margulisiibacteriota bacterium]